MAEPPKRKRRESDTSGNEDEQDKFVPYVPVKERRKQQLLKLGRIVQLTAEASNVAKSSSENEHDEEETEESWGRKYNISLLDQHTELKKIAEAKKISAVEKQLKEEEKILESVAEKKALMGVAELAKGIQYEDPIKTSWTPPRYILAKSISRHEKIRENLRILTDGEDVPPPLCSFREMKLPKAILLAMAKRNIKKPSPIQVQGIPAVLAGRDLIALSLGNPVARCCQIEEIAQPSSRTSSRIPGPVSEFVRPNCAIIMKVINNLLLKRTSTYLVGIAGAVFFFERGFDLITDAVFTSHNKGKLWDDIKHKYEQ
ncbi:ATP-dependent RNA helicase abstrakt [Anopheles darlingi]|uniref:Cytochrome b-c1 complex subunit 9 n=1 Tax=Anopheles darlingi TaxID=43151 RepID=W5J7Q0_ANODA|nr:ATP-dependent RNA helicase abstrakt [Anopheles darlingi]